MRIASDLDGMALTRWCGDFVFVIAILWIFTIPLCRADEEIVRVERGGSVTLPCKYRGDGVIASVKWFKSDSFIVEFRGEQLKPHDIAPHYSTDPNRKDKNDFSINPSPVEIRHEGNFTCRINLQGKADEVKTINLEVTAKPQVEFIMNKGLKANGQWVTVARCTARNGRPPAAITWISQLEGKAIETRNESNGLVTIVSDYQVKLTDESEGEKVSCRVDHSSLEKHHWIKEDIIVLAEVQVVIVERGGSATLPCMYHGDGNIFAVKWSKSHSVMVEYRGEPLKPYISAYDTNVPNGKDKNDFSIIIRPADIHHEGIFTCRINVKGNSDVVRTIKLEVPECSLNNLLQLIKNMGIAFGVVLSLLLLTALILFKLGYLSCPCFFSKSNDVQDCNEFSVIQAEVNV